MRGKRKCVLLICAITLARTSAFSPAVAASARRPRFGCRTSRPTGVGNTCTRTALRAVAADEAEQRPPTLSERRAAAAALSTFPRTKRSRSVTAARSKPAQPVATAAVTAVTGGGVLPERRKAFWRRLLLPDALARSRLINVALVLACLRSSIHTSSYPAALEALPQALAQLREKVDERFGASDASAERSAQASAERGDTVMAPDGTWLRIERSRAARAVDAEEGQGEEEGDLTELQLTETEAAVAEQLSRAAAWEMSELADHSSGGSGDSNGDGGGGSNAQAANAVRELPPRQENAIGEVPGRQSSSFVAVAARAVAPAVCRVDTERIVLGGGLSLDDQQLPAMPFGPFDGGGGGGSSGKVEQGQGSGVIFSADGLVLTNAHVVNGANKVTVTLTDGRKLLATVKGADELTDLAVLKIEGEGENIPFPVAQLGDSEELSVGDWVIAVGNPVGLDSTVTLGIVSSLKRSSQEVGIPDRKVTFIQTDAAINPGNSGGALVNERGEVVGINTAIRAYAEGIGFAIPVNKAKQIMYELAEGRAIQHPYIGVHMTTVTPDMARQNNLDPNAPNELPEVYGAMVIMVLPSTPAYDAGLRRFDVVIEMKGARIKNAGDIVSQVDECMVGENVPLKVLRAGRVMDLSIRPRDVLEMRQRQQLQQQQRQQQQQQQGGGWLPFPGESQLPPGGSGGPPNTPPPGRGGGGNSSPHRTPGRRFGGGGLPGLPGFPGLP